MGKSKPIDHARHNSNVCMHLFSETEYHDWIITTAFYSSLHYIEHKLFPLEEEINGKNFKFSSFDGYYSAYKSIANDPQNKHSQRSFLINKKEKAISPAYKQLKDICWTARYIDYNFDKEVSLEATKLLSEIEEYCCKKGTKK